VNKDKEQKISDHRMYMLEKNAYSITKLLNENENKNLHHLKILYIKKADNIEAIVSF